ncbi:MAG: isocitrate/isopropylmalate family dehydrogenase, partial [bacterium]|nr:isocitrate/isopropylmalate family dehydrogenase [bacterium]
MTYHILILPGDGIGPEVVRESLSVLDLLSKKFSLDFKTETALIGGASLDAIGHPIAGKTLEQAKRSDAVLLGAVGGVAWDHVSPELKPEKALLKIRSYLGLYANLRPVRLYPSLQAASPLKPEVIEKTDILVVRELTGGIYFGQPR